MGVATAGQTPQNASLDLITFGPIVEVIISPHNAIARQLLAQGVNPPTVTGMALIDTGASMTCVDVQAAATLKVPIVGQMQLASVSHPTSTHPLYPIHIQFSGISVSVEAPRATGTPLASLGIVALLGRDALQTCVLIYNGVAGHFTLAVA
jgi:hypothetical protein